MQQQEAIEMTQEWADELKQFKQFSRSKGRFMHLLKKKTKVAMAEKVAGKARIEAEVQLSRRFLAWIS